MEASSSGAPLRHPDGRPLVSPRTVRGALAIADGVFSRGGRGLPPERAAWLAREIEDYLSRGSVAARLMLSAMIALVSLVAPLMIARLGPLGRLATSDKARALERLEARFGEPLLAVKAMLCLLYYEHADAAREVGFDGECLLPRAPSWPRGAP